MGGQTALNTALSLHRSGVLDKYGVEMIGARAEAIDKAEDRELFREAMTKIGLETLRSRLADAATLKRADREKYKTQTARIAEIADPAERAAALASFEHSWGQGEGARRRRYVEKGLIEALEALSDIGLPAIIRPAFTLGGTGGGIAYNREEFQEIVERGLDALADLRGPRRGVGPRLEGIRDGGHPRPRRQLHHHLLHRELRPDGRPSATRSPWRRCRR